MFFGTLRCLGSNIDVIVVLLFFFFDGCFVLAFFYKDYSNSFPSTLLNPMMTVNGHIVLPKFLNFSSRSSLLLVFAWPS